MRRSKALAGMVAGYSVCFVVEERVKQITMADKHERVIERLIGKKFGKAEILSRAPLDSRAIGLLELKAGEWLEWVPVARGALNIFSI